jgi:hypothetical protein
MNGLTRLGVLIAMVPMFSALIAAQAPAKSQPAFATPEEAVHALAAAAKASDVTALVALLGPGSEELASSADAATARKNRDVFLAAMTQQWTLEDRDAMHKELVVGHEAWPFPVPLAKAANGWVFDAAAGKEEVLARRIGRNELSAIGVANSYVKAQKLYASRGHDGKPAGAYARRLVSDPGTENGLYWPASPGKPRSPIGELFAEAVMEGKPNGNAKGRSPFHGYYFRYLEAKGSGGAGGFGMIAWPSQPGVTGVMTFIVNQDGVVYEKSFGRDTASAVAAITRFNPDKSWTRVTQ